MSADAVESDGTLGRDLSFLLEGEAVERFGSAADQSQLMAEWYETQ